jgi:hypothetical protein
VLVQAAVQDRHLMAVRHQAFDDRKPGRTGATDDKNPHGKQFLLTRFG